ncbi:Retrovirus-related Pol polyprotein from transposon TNT 1-94 [Scenedesmus sp. PABB004]|nr:Retrovirus-related Pol polyprotein from transposon TNT 1-94 [Scenedesmus sp. PABB004]
MMDFEKFGVERFTGSNYVTWSTKITFYLKLKGFYGALIDAPPPGNDADAAPRATPRGTTRPSPAIVLSVDNKILPLIQTCTTAKEAWDKLANMYHTQNTASIDNLISAGATVDDMDISLAMLDKLPSAYEVTKKIIMSKKPFPTLEEVISELLTVEAQTPANTEKAYFATAPRPKFKPLNKTSNPRFNKPFNPRAHARRVALRQPAAPVQRRRLARRQRPRFGASKDAKDVCYYCKKPGHFIEAPEAGAARFGHLGYANLERAAKHGMVTGMDLTTTDFKALPMCEPCVMGKTTRLPFGDVTPAVKEVLTYMEKQTDAHVKAVRTDNGSEYVNADLSGFFKDKGIAHQKTHALHARAKRHRRAAQPHAPQQGAPMIYAAELPPAAWGEAIMTANHLRNLSPVSGKPKTPFEAFFGRKPDVSTLRVFGATAYAHVPKEKRTKLEPHAEKGIMVGYPAFGKGYRILMPDGNIKSSRNVVFDESKVLSKSFANYKSPTLIDPDITRYAAEKFPADDAFEDEPDSGAHDGAPPSGSPPGTPGGSPPASPGGSPPSSRAARRRPRRARRPRGNDNMPAPTAGGTDSTTGGTITRSGRVSRKPDRPRGNIERYKGRIVAKGFHQIEGIDYDEVFAPVGKYATLRAALYGLKQAPRAWHSRLHEELTKMGFAPSKADASLYVGTSGAYILIYVDDILIIARNRALAESVKAELFAAFKTRDLGEVSQYLGMHITRDRINKTIKITNEKMVTELVSKYGLADCAPRDIPVSLGTKLTKDNGDPLEHVAYPYTSLVGALLYLSITVRPDIAFAVSALTRFMSCPTTVHWGVAKGVLRYLAGTTNIGIIYGGIKGSLDLNGMCDSDYAADLDTRRSTTGYVFTLNGGAITWSSKKQQTVAASTTEAEYMAASAAVKEALWLRKLMSDLKFNIGAIDILSDNQGAIKLLRNPRVARGEVTFHYVPTADNIADALTKPLALSKFVACRTGMGMV